MTEQRPPIWIGHVQMRSRVLDETEAFMKQVGLRGIFRGDEVAVLELRGGTHVVVVADPGADPADAAFDFMVEDLESTHARFRDMGLEVTDIEQGRIHNSFRVTEPGGNRIVVNSTHVPDHTLV